MFFVTFTYVGRLWDPFIKALHTLHASRLNLPNKIKYLQFVHISELIWIDPITHARYYNHRTYYFHKLITKDHSFFGYIFDFFLVNEFQNHGSEHEHGLLWIKIAPMYGMHTNEKIEKFVDIYISCDVSLLPNPLQNAQQHQHTRTCKKKTILFVNFITHCFLCMK